MGHDAVLIFLAAGVGLVSKIIFDWLKGRNGNGSSGKKPTAFWEAKFDGLGVQIEKKIDNSLQIAVVPILQRQTEILDEMRQDSKELYKAILKIGLRDELRDELKGA